ncbi:unnamed protein product [Blepharisma stoltei]|uniref:Nuclear pore complex protein Nup88 n=1 Tax=Blepharisma stoltei TaxID=1481888 RepID=A0AAU9J123_9CILI|nr:unnamed protein product [Blepharisma stoltei]
MENAIRDLQNPLLSWNPESASALILNRSKPYNLYINPIDSNSQQIKNLSSLPFYPLSMKPHLQRLAIVGEDQLLVISIDTDTEWKLIRFNGKILDYHWHPLSESALAVLTPDMILRIYDVLVSIREPEIEWRIPIDILSSNNGEPVSFCFLQEKEKSLSRFSCIVLMSNGDLYVISPAIPRKFSVLKEFTNFEKIMKIQNNSYSLYEPSSEQWVNEITNNILLVSQNLRKAYISLPNFVYQNYIAVPQGPISFYEKNISSDERSLEYDEIFCLSSFNPIVFLLKQVSGSLVLLVGFGDINISFSSRDSNLNLSVFEQIKFEGQNGVIRISDDDKIYYLCNNSLYQISLPWLSQLKESCILGRVSKDIKHSVVKEINKNLPGSSLAIIHHRIRYNYALISLEQEIRKIDLKLIREKGEFFNLDLNELEINLPKESLSEPINIPPPPAVDVNLPDITNEEQELAALTLVVDKLYEKCVLPLSKKAEFLKTKVDDCKEWFNKLKNSASFIKADSAIKLFNSIQGLEEKMKNVERNSEILKEKIDRILQKQNRVNLPLSSAERDLAMKVTQLEKMTNSLKTIAKTKLLELKAEKAALKKLNQNISLNPRLENQINELKHKCSKIAENIKKYETDNQ